MQAQLKHPGRTPAGGPTARAGDAGVRAIETALDALRAGRPVAFPTETVWGIAAPAGSESAVAAVVDWKGRDANQPMAVLVSDTAVLSTYGVVLSPLAQRIADDLWPGAVTLVVPCSRTFATGVAGRDGAIGLRCSAHPVAMQLALAAEEAGIGPLTATSLNRSGEPPAIDRTEALEVCSATGSPLVLDFDGWGADASGAAPTTVVDLTRVPGRVLRWGGVGARAFAPFADEIDMTAPAGAPADQREVSNEEPNGKGAHSG